MLLVHFGLYSIQHLNLCAWTLSLALMVHTVLGFHPFYPFSSTNSTSFEYGLYSAYSHIFWTIPLCYIIFACSHNSGGAINRFLSHPFWQTISNLSYAIFLVHHPIVLLTAASIKTLPYFNEITFIRSVIGNVGLSILVAIPLTLAFDSPIDTIVKLFKTSASTMPRKPSSMTNDNIEKKISWESDELLQIYYILLTIHQKKNIMKLQVEFEFKNFNQ